MSGKGGVLRFDRNLIVIGAGAAGLVASYTAAAAGAAVTLVERHRMGGDCLNTGCVPSKALIRSARMMADLQRCADFGIEAAGVEVDFSKVMERVRSVIRRVEPHDSLERYRALGVDCIIGEARIVSPNEVEIDGKRLTARALVVATGAAPRVPPLPGIDDIAYLTSDNLWQLTRLPERLLILGGGPIGCELGQSFARFGSKVAIVDLAERLLSPEDSAVSDRVARSLADAGVDLYLGCVARQVVADGDGGILVIERSGRREELQFDRLLVAAGRRPDTRGLGLAELGVESNANGTVKTDRCMRTSVKGIYACGDVTGPFQLTHAAGRQGWYAAMNALYGGLWRFKIDYRAMPHVVFTDPEVARVGMNRREAVEQGVAFDVSRYELAELDRAIAEGENSGYLEVLTVPGTDRILGATLVGAHAGELVGQFTAAMQGGYGLKRILSTIQPYPTYAEAPVLLAGQWRRERIAPWMLALSRRYLRLRRS